MKTHANEKKDMFRRVVNKLLCDFVSCIKSVEDNNEKNFDNIFGLLKSTENAPLVR